MDLVITPSLRSKAKRAGWQDLPHLPAWAAVALLLGSGGALAQATEPPQEPTAPPVAAWPKPIELPIRMPPAGGSQDWTQLSVVVGKGLVSGSPEAVASIGRPLEGLEGRSRVVGTCKKAVWNSVSKAGAETIEAVAERTDRRTRKGWTYAPVTMRLSYVKPATFEVKKSTVICVVDRAGRFVDAYTPAAGYREGGGRSTREWTRLTPSTGPAVPRSR